MSGNFLIHIIRIIESYVKLEPNFVLWSILNEKLMILLTDIFNFLYEENILSEEA